MNIHGHSSVGIGPSQRGRVRHRSEPRAARSQALAPNCPLPLASPHGRAPLLGREAEERRIGALLAAARNGRGGALLILGEPGIGKSSLLGLPTAAPGDARADA